MRNVQGSISIAALALAFPIVALADLTTSVTVSANQYVSLDTGTISGSSDDLRFTGTSITPQGVATASNIGAGLFIFGLLTQAQLADAQYSQAPLTGASLAIDEATFKDTGPVTLSFFVNGHLLDKATYSASGPQHIDKPVPRDWVEAGKDATVGAEIDKPWISPGDGVALGFILTRMGLTQE